MSSKIVVVDCRWFLQIPSAARNPYRHHDRGRRAPSLRSGCFKKALHAILLPALLFCSPLHLFADQPGWVQVHSAHFTVATDAGEDRGRQVAVRFEQMRDVFGTLLQRARINTSAPLEIVAFRNTREFRNFAPLWHGKPVELAGLFQMGEDRSFILLDLSAPDPYPTIYHEYAHWLLNSNYPRTQPWFDEGFAEYYRGMTFNGKEARLGFPPEGTEEVLHHNSLMPVLALFSVGHDSKIYNESGDHRTMFYAESWLVLHYIFDHNLLAQTGKYFELIENDNKPVGEAIQQAFGMAPEALDKLIREYRDRGEGKAGTLDLPDVQGFNYTADKLSATDAQAILADAHLHSPDYQQKAIAEFEEILGSDPANAAAHRGLGYAYLYQRAFAKAAPHFRRAAQLDPNDPRVLYLSALLVSREAAAGGKAPNLGEMRAQLEQSVRLDPQFADAYNLLAIVQMQEGSASAAVKSEAQALKLKPREEMFMMNYAGFLAANRQLDEARAVLARLQSSDNPGIVTAANAETERLSERPSSAAVKVTTEGDKSADASPTRGGEEADPVRSARPARDEAPAPDKRPILYVKGKLLRVDCSAQPAAVITLASGKQTWKLRTADRNKLVLMGADTFSCDWSNRNAGVNYRASGNATGELVSLEIE